VGDSTPDGMQRLLNNFQWDADAVRDDLRDYVAEHLGEADGVLIVDETGFLKKASSPPVCSCSTPAPPGGSRTASSGCSSPTPAAKDER
jgi:hypothetical protein